MSFKGGRLLPCMNQKAQVEEVAQKRTQEGLEDPTSVDIFPHQKKEESLQEWNSLSKKLFYNIWTG